MLAAELAGRSDAIAERLDLGDPCGARAEAEVLQSEVINSVNAGLIPPRYQEELGAAVSSLLAALECPPAGEVDG